MTTLGELADAFPLFAARHMEAVERGLRTGDVEAAREALRGLSSGFDEAAAVLAADTEAPAATRAVLAKRVAEAEGALMHLRLDIARRPPDAFALAAGLEVARLAVRGALAAMAASREPSSTSEGDLRERLRLARRALIAGAPAAALALLEPTAASGADALDAWAALDAAEAALATWPAKDTH